MRKILSYIITHLRIVYLVTIMLGTVALILFMFPDQYTRVQYDYSAGGFWKSEDLYAPYDFAVLKSEKSDRDELSAADSIYTYYFTVDSNASQVAMRRVASVRLPMAERRTAKQIVSLVYDTPGYMSDTITVEGHNVILLNGNVGREVDGDAIVTKSDVLDLVRQNVSDSVKASELTSLLTDSVLVPSMVFDATRTQLERDSRISQLSHSSRMVQQGELIVSKGQHIDNETALVIASFEKSEQARRSSEFNETLHYVGQALLCIIAFVALYIFLKNIRHPMLEDVKKVAFGFFMVTLISAVVALIVRVKVDWVLLAPVCIVPILMRIFFDMRVALYIHIVTVIIIGNMVPNSYEFIFYQLVSGMMSIITVRNFEKRSNFFAVALVIFATYSLIYFAGLLSQDTGLGNINYERFLIFFFNAILTLLAYPLIFLFERMFGMTTNLTLMEISSTNTPALRELSNKAPGTFQHSISVANISEDIINEIGGNALLAKVGALYHDIGKTMAPLYFTENQNTDFNPHENLDYEDSARIITQHVRDGITLAKKYRLPSEVTDFIRTHHGTTVTGYFYAQARLHHSDEEIDMTPYRYLGPTPFSRETAVVMLVDSVEAACKSLKNHTKEDVYKMVDHIIDDKVKTKQLNNCPLTLSDINQIRTLLKERMMSIYHVRISYPVVN